MPLVQRKVFVPNDLYHDYSPAESYGYLIFLTRGEINRFEVSQIFQSVQHALAEANDYDYLVMSSMPVITSLASAILAMKFRKLNLLQYHGKQQRYIERTIVFPNEELSYGRTEH